MRLTLVLTAVVWATVASAEPPRVAVDIAPVHSLVAQVMDGVGVPDLIIRPGASPHHYALRPSEASMLSDADLVFWMGEGLTPWMAGAIEKLAGDARQVALLEAEGTHVLARREAATFEDQPHGETDAHVHHDAADPHAWLSPENARQWLFLIAAELSTLDPEHAETYRANAARRSEELDRLTHTIAGTLQPVKSVPLMVFHDAYHYFEEAFGIQAAAVSLSDASQPGPARIARLRKLARDHHITCMLTEPQFDPKLADAILGEGFKTGVLDPMGTQFDPGPALYPAMMTALAAGFASCSR